jgi:sec-independent protein translocase protein TatC
MSEGDPAGEDEAAGEQADPEEPQESGAPREPRDSEGAADSPEPPTDGTADPADIEDVTPDVDTPPADTSPEAVADDPEEGERDEGKSGDPSPEAADDGPQVDPETYGEPPEQPATADGPEDEHAPEGADPDDAAGDEEFSTELSPMPEGSSAPDPGPIEPAAAGAGGGGFGTGAGAPDDEEMPLTEHIEEMVKRLGVVIVVMALISAVTFPFADRLINFLWYSFLPGSVEECLPVARAAAGGTGGGSTTAACPRIYNPLALVFARLKVASLAGFIIALPVFVYETYLFMRPGLYPRERKYYLSSVPTSLVLAAVGIAFAYFLVLPVIFTYFLGYSEPVANIAFGLSETFDLIILMLGLFAFIFQIPLFVMLAILMGVTSRAWLVSRRLYFWAGFAGIAFLFSPDPTGMAPFIVAVTMIALFEGTLLLLRWTGR